MAEGLSENDSVQTNSSLNKFLSNKINLVVVGLLLVGLFMLAFGAGMFLLKGSKSEDDIKIISSEEKADSGKIVVHVDGAISKPGVYELSVDSRVNDLVAMAGGLAEDANTDSINLAAKLSDGQKVYLPRVGESVKGTTSNTSSAGSESTGLININTATEAQLDTLPSVGMVTAQKIIASRPYSSLEELMSKKAVGSATYNKIKDLITVY